MGHFLASVVAFIPDAAITMAIAILLQRPVYCFWRADFHGQGATLIKQGNMPTILPC
jgi:hypothetical protein